MSGVSGGGGREGEGEETCNRHDRQLVGEAASSREEHVTPTNQPRHLINTKRPDGDLPRRHRENSSPLPLTRYHVNEINTNRVRINNDKFGELPK